MTPLATIFALPVRLYRITFSPFVGMHCRYHPTCSAYTLEALEKHGALKGGGLALARILRCHPWGASGIDDVPGTAATDDPSSTCSTSRRFSSGRD